MNIDAKETMQPLVEIMSGSLRTGMATPILVGPKHGYVVPNPTGSEPWVFRSLALGIDRIPLVWQSTRLGVQQETRGVLQPHGCNKRSSVEAISATSIQKTGLSDPIFSIFVHSSNFLMRALLP